MASRSSQIRSVDRTTKVYQRERSKFWQLRWTDRSGKEIRCSSGTEDYEEAVSKLEQLSSSSSLTFAEASLRFLEEHQMRPATKKGYMTSLRAWRPYVGKLRLEEITQLEIRKFVSARLKEVKESSIRNDLAFLSSLFTFSMMLPEGPENNPVERFNKRHLAVSPKRVRWLTDDQVATLLGAIKKHEHKLIVLFGLEAGLRKSEILNLRVWQIDRARNKILLRADQTKVDEGRSVPISQTLRRALDAHFVAHPKLQDGDVLLPSSKSKIPQPYVDLRPWWEDALTKAKLTDFHFHDTRHHFGCRYVMRGGRIQALQKMMGHSSVQQTEVYAFLEHSDAHREFETLDRK